MVVAPDRERLGYVPALDGLRALAVLAVLAFHGGVPWLGGGFLGVDAFFVLSGFLITTLLVQEWQATGTVRLRVFWARRAKRLLPALLVVLVFVASYAALAVAAGTYPDLRADVVSTLFYVGNWHLLAAGSSYFGQTALPSPLTHTWSLAIEEQFYVCWPLVVLAILGGLGGGRRGRRRSPRDRGRRLLVLGVVCAAGALGSALEMALLYRAGASTARLYYGTDTHAQCLLVGAALAVALVRWPGDSRATNGWSRRVRFVGLAGALGVAATAVLWWRLDGTTGFLYQGGFLVASVAIAAVIVAVRCRPRSLLSGALSLAPLRALGRISYGVYLWHYPLFLLLDHARTGLGGGALLGARVAVTIAVAALSFHFVEQPVRRGRIATVPWLSAAGAATAALVVASGMPIVAVGVPPAVPASAAVASAGTARAGTPTNRGTTGQLRVLLVGDSVAVTLGVGLSEEAARYGVIESDQGIVGCGVTSSTEVITRGAPVTVPWPCRSQPAPATVPALSTTPPSPGHEPYPDGEQSTAWYAGWVARFHPAVVVLLAGRWEVATQEVGGRWANILQPSFAASVKRQLEAMVRVLTAAGARAVLMTAPCFDPGEQPDGAPWPTASPTRLDAFNRVIEEVGAEMPHTSVLNLDAMVCPGGRYRQDMSGVAVRTPDGVHFTLTGGRLLARRIWPSVVADAGGRA